MIPTRRYDCARWREPSRWKKNLFAIRELRGRRSLWLHAFTFSYSFSYSRYHMPTIAVRPTQTLDRHRLILIHRCVAQHRVWGVIISIEFPTSSARIQGHLQPTLAVELYSGSFADSVREDSGSRGNLLGDRWISSEVRASRRRWGVAQPSVKPPSDEGIGHNQHPSVWPQRGEESPTDHQHHHHYHITFVGPMIHNASVIFSSRPLRRPCRTTRASSMRSATTIEANGKRRKWRPIPPPTKLRLLSSSTEMTVTAEGYTTKSVTAVPFRWPAACCTSAPTWPTRRLPTATASAVEGPT